MKGLKQLTPIALTAFMLFTPVFTAPKLPTIPNLTGSIELPVGAQEAAKKAGQDAVKGLKIDWSKIDFGFRFNNIL